jgi:radical SAM superfamily enzyme YgiQ (UPF0313 family)
MARVLLAKARFTDNSGDNVVPPLGAMYVASVLRNEGHEVLIHDPGAAWWDLEPFRQVLQSWRPDIVGISAITIEARSMEAMALLARSTLPDVPIVVGGPHASAYPERCARHPGIDYVVMGEGETTSVELVRVLSDGGDPASIAGILFRGPDGEIVRTEERAAIQDLDALPFPAWDLIDVRRYVTVRTMSKMGRRPYMLMFTSRGCPFKCIYCHEVQGKKFRARSPQNVFAEMDALRRTHGINDFEIVDDIFNFDRERMLEIMARVRDANPKPALHFPNGLRTDILDEKQIKALRAAGAQSLMIAVETVSPRLQKLAKKYLKLDRVAANIRIAVKEGLFVGGLFMLGFPSETLEEARATVEFAVSTNLHQALFFVVTPFAGTELYEVYLDMLRQRGINPAEDGLDFFAGNYNLSVMKDSELFGLHREAYRRFYLSPKRIARVVARYPRRMQLPIFGAQALIRMMSRRREGSLATANAAEIPPRPSIGAIPTRVAGRTPRKTPRPARQTYALPLAGS